MPERNCLMVEAIGEHAINLPNLITERTRSPIKKVLLINPNVGENKGVQISALTGPTGLKYLAGSISDLVPDVAIHDDAVDPGGWRRKLNTFSPDLIGVSYNYTVAGPEVKKLSSEIRKIAGENFPLVVGGHAVSLTPNTPYAKDFNAIVPYAGEKKFSRLVTAYGQTGSFESVEGIYHRNADGELMSNVVDENVPKDQRVEFNSPLMDSLPLPRTDLIDQFRDSYYVLHYHKPYTLRTADGCIGSCIFCDIHKFFNKTYRSESPEKTIQKLQAIPDGSIVVIPDDFAFFDVKGWNKIADYLIQTKKNLFIWAQTRADHIANNRPLFEKLHQAGLRMLLVGFESFDSVDLKKVGKGVQADKMIQYNLEAIKILKEIGIDIWGAQILFQRFTRDNFLRILEFNNEKKIEFPQYAIFTPYPGTVFYEQQFQLGNLTGNEDPRLFDLFHSLLPTTGMSKEEFYAWRDALCLKTGNPAIRLRQDIRTGFTTMKDFMDFGKRVKETYDTPRCRELIAREGVVFDAKNHNIV